MAQFICVTVWEVIGPVRVGTVKVAVRVHHLRLHPQAKIHTQGVYIPDQFVQAAGEFLRVHKPVPQPGTVVVASAEPAVIHHKQFHPDLGGNLRQAGLIRHIYIKFRGLPGIVQHRQRLCPEPGRQQVFRTKAVHLARHFAQSLRFSTVHRRSLKARPRL